MKELTVLNVALGDVHDSLTKFTKGVVFHVLLEWTSQTHPDSIFLRVKLYADDTVV